METSAEQYFKELPENFQRAITDTPWKKIQAEINHSNNLTVEQGLILETETMLVLYGIEEAADYSSNLVRELGIEEETAELITRNVTEKIFEPIAEKAKDFKAKNSKSLEISPQNLPMIEKGEVAHDVPHEEPKIEAKPTIVPQTAPEAPKVEVKQEEPLAPPRPAYSYPGGKDPYREPIN